MTSEKAVAERNAAKALNHPDDFLAWLPPRETQWDTAKAVVWYTVCLRYRVVRLEGNRATGDRYAVCYNMNLGDPARPRWAAALTSKSGGHKGFKSLANAFAAALAHFKGQMGRRGAKDNAAEMVRAAHAQGITDFGPALSQSGEAAYNGSAVHVLVPTLGGEPMKVPIEAARGALAKAGFLGAEGWSGPKVIRELNEIHRLDQAKVELVGEDADLWNKVLEAHVRGEQVTLEDAVEINHSGDGEGNVAVATKPKRTRAPKAEKAEGKAAPKAEVKLDPYGSKVGSVQARVNATLTARPKSMKQIMEEAGVNSTYYEHLGKLVKKGLVVKTDEGFARAPRK
jgi:hypothetical protein